MKLGPQNPNGWKKRLQNFTFGWQDWQRPYSIDHNQCPYFWLTIFCLLVSPVVFCFIAPMRWLAKRVNKSLRDNDKKNTINYETKWDSLINKDKAYIYGIFSRMYIREYTEYKKYLKGISGFNWNRKEFEYNKKLWVYSSGPISDMVTDIWDDIYLLSKYEIEVRDKECIDDRIKRNIMVSKIIQYLSTGAKWLFYLILNLVGILFIVKIPWALLLASILSWVFWIYFVLCVVSIGITICLVLFIIYLSKKFEIVDKFINAMCKFGLGLLWVLKVVFWPIEKIATFIAEWYENSCPELEWKNDNRKNNR